MKFSTIIFPFTFILMALPTTGFSDSFDSKAREGVTHYNREEFDRAASKFQASQLEKPENPNVAYNLANSHYRLGRYEEAIETYKKVLSENSPPELKQKSFFNMGNAYYRMGYLDEAIESYKNALELRPGDMDSKFNLEWTRQQQEKAQQSGQVGPRDKSILKQPATVDQANNPPAPQEKPPESKKDESENLQTAENNSSDKPEPPDKKAPAPTDEEVTEQEKAVLEALREMTQMSPEEAERWLGSLSEDLKKITRRQMQGNMKDMFVDHDKDW